MRCVGYRQAWEFLDALEVPTQSAAPARLAARPQTLSDLRDKGIAATRQLAKRQITWLRSMPERCIVPCDAPDALQQVLAMVDGFVARG